MQRALTPPCYELILSLSAKGNLRRTPGNKFPGYKEAPITNSCSTVRKISTCVDSIQRQELQVFLLTSQNLLL